MSATAEAAPARHLGAAEIVVDFDAERVKAPFFLRCGALLIDYIVLISIPVAGLMLTRYLGSGGPGLLGGSVNDAAWLVAVMIGFINLIVLPVFSGQSVGKMLAGLRIVGSNGAAAPKGAVLLRQTGGYLLVFLTFGLGFLIAAAGRKGRALHDLLTGTIVIFADRRIR